MGIRVCERCARVVDVPNLRLCSKCATKHHNEYEDVWEHLLTTGREYATAEGDAEYKRARDTFSKAIKKAAPIIARGKRR